MVTSERPDGGNPFASIFEQHLSVEPPNLCKSQAKCSPDFDTLVKSLLVKSPEDRPFNVRTVQGILSGRLAKETQSIETAQADDRGPTSKRLIQFSLHGRFRYHRPRENSWHTIVIVGLAIRWTVLVMSLLQNYF